jgi:predicted nucleic acid-binding protein
MPVAVLVDTDVLIDVQKGHPGATAWFASLSDLPGIPGFVAMELLQDAQNLKQVRDAQRLIAPFTIVWPSEADCERALADYSAFHYSHGLGLLDSLIAACAVGCGAPLYTFNVKHYRVVPSLTTVQPYTK